jgi:glycosyltransferase involved in cell wall biosynthesis
MRVGLVIGQIRKVGGMEKQAILLAKELKDRGIDVTLFISGPKKRTATLDVGPIRHRYLYYTKHTGWLSNLLIKYHCRAGRISHIIAFNAFNAQRAIESGADCKIILSVRGTRFASDTVLGEKYRRAAERCDHVVTNSCNTATLIKNSGMAGGKEITVIHNGIALPEKRAHFEGKTILWVGSFKDVKDPMTFVEACCDLIREDKDIEVFMAGDGPSRPEIEGYLHANGLAGNFDLPGELPYSHIPYGKASVFVNSSIRESSSNSLLEALAFGIPVVATDNPGNRAVLEGLEYHHIIPKRDSSALSDAIRELLNIDSETRDIISDVSRQHIEKRYSVRNMVNAYINLLNGG